MSAEFVANMEDVLDLYAEPYDPQRRCCFDETSTQLLADPALSAAPAWTSPAAGLRIPAGRHPQSAGLRRWR